ncbi:MAG: anthranilate phosphoribosyltransferase [Myxococcota bacterium]
MHELLENLLDGEELDREGVVALLDGLSDPDVPDVLKAAALAAMRVRGETAAEVRDLARELRDRAVAFEPDASKPVVDTCGTGGDGSGSINLSTAAALVVAAMGHGVVKHGNRRSSSKCGSADVLEALGVPLPEGPRDAARMLDETGFTFLFAPNFHPSTAGVVPVRRALRTRTVFNLLGPLTNPARPAYQVVGAYSAEAAALMADALAGLAVTRAFVVHGAEGWDEATPIGPFELWDVRPGDVVRHRELDPARAYGIPRCTADDLQGGDADFNAAALRRVFRGEKGPHRDAVALSAALVLEVLGIAEERDAVSRVEAALDNGAVTALLTRLQSYA